MPKEKGLAKKHKLSQEKVKVMLKRKSLAKKCRFSQKELKVVPKRKSLAKRYRFSYEKIEGKYVRGWSIESRFRLIM